MQMSSRTADMQISCPWTLSLLEVFRPKASLILRGGVLIKSYLQPVPAGSIAMLHFRISYIEHCYRYGICGHRPRSYLSFSKTGHPRTTKKDDEVYSACFP